MPNLGFETLRDPFYGSQVVGPVTDVVRDPGCFISVTTSLGKRVMRAALLDWDQTTRGKQGN